MDTHPKNPVRRQDTSGCSRKYLSFSNLVFIWSWTKKSWYDFKIIVTPDLLRLFSSHLKRKVTLNSLSFCCCSGVNAPTSFCSIPFIPNIFFSSIFRVLPFQSCVCFSLRTSSPVIKRRFYIDPWHLSQVFLFTHKNVAGRETNPYLKICVSCLDNSFTYKYMHSELVA